MDSLASRLKFARDHRKLTQVQLAKEAGLNQSDISKLERGEMQQTTALPALARALVCDVDWLETGEGDPDFGRVRRGWPFRGIDPARWAALTEDQRLIINNAVLGMIEGFERSPAAGSGKSSDYQARRAA